MKKRVYFTLLVALILMIGVCGCTMNHNEKPSNSTVTLTERQVAILEQYGLPVNYEELTTTQQEAIVTIEEMLCYVEEKYNQKFAYAGYTPNGLIESEHMRAYPVSGNEETDTFTISKSENGFVDDYINIAVNPRLCDYVLSSAQRLVPDTQIKIYAEVTETSLTDPSANETAFDGTTEAILWIFLDGATFDEAKLEEFVSAFNAWMTDHKLYGAVQIVLLKENTIAYLTKYNYTNYLSETHYICRENIYINK